MGKTKATGITRIIKAGGYSCQGFKAVYIHEAAFRQELWLSILMTPFGLYFGETWIEKAALICSLLFVLITELFNSAIEAAVDRIGEEHHELSGRAKDIASATVLLALVMTAIIWVAVLI